MYKLTLPNVGKIHPFAKSVVSTMGFLGVGPDWKAFANDKNQVEVDV